MNKELENEIDSILDQQIALKDIETFAGNIVKKEFHKGAIFGIKLILDTIAASNKSLQTTPKVEPKCTCHPHDLVYYGCRCR